MADIYLRYVLMVPRMVGPRHLNWDARNQIEGLADWEKMMADSDISRKVDQDLSDNEADFMAHVSGMR